MSYFIDRPTNINMRANKFFCNCAYKVNSDGSISEYVTTNGNNDNDQIPSYVQTDGLNFSTTNDTEDASATTVYKNNIFSPAISCTNASVTDSDGDAIKISAKEVTFTAADGSIGSRISNQAVFTDTHGTGTINSSSISLKDATTNNVSSIGFGTVELTNGSSTNTASPTSTVITDGVNTMTMNNYQIETIHTNTDGSTGNYAMYNQAFLELGNDKDIKVYVDPNGLKLNSTLLSETDIVKLHALETAAPIGYNYSSGISDSNSTAFIGPAYKDSIAQSAVYENTGSTIATFLDLTAGNTAYIDIDVTIPTALMTYLNLQNATVNGSTDIVGNQNVSYFGIVIGLPTNYKYMFNFGVYTGPWKGYYMTGATFINTANDVDFYALHFKPNNSTIYSNDVDSSVYKFLQGYLTINCLYNVSNQLDKQPGSIESTNFDITKYRSGP